MLLVQLVRISIKYCHWRLPHNICILSTSVCVNNLSSCGKIGMKLHRRFTELKKIPYSRQKISAKFNINSLMSYWLTAIHQEWKQLYYAIQTKFKISFQNIDPENWSNHNFILIEMNLFMFVKVLAQSRKQHLLSSTMASLCQV